MDILVIHDSHFAGDERTISQSVRDITVVRIPFRTYSKEYRLYFRGRAFDAVFLTHGLTIEKLKSEPEAWTVLNNTLVSRKGEIKEVVDYRNFADASDG